MSEKYRVMDLFSGIGGFSLGFLQSGFHIVSAIESSRKACSIYSENFPHVDVVCSDIMEVDINRLPEIDVIIGWLPSTPFSKTREIQTLGFGLITKQLEIIENKRPKAFIIETNMYRRDDEYMSFFIKSSIQLGYSIKCDLIDSEKVVGIPIREKRCYIVGVLNKNINFEFIEQANKHSFKEIMQNRCEIADQEAVNIKLTQLEKKNVKIINPDSDIIKCNYINIPYVKDDVGLRRITRREYARLKGFPDDYKITNKNIREMYQLLSLATNVKVAELMGRQLKKALDREIEYKFGYEKSEKKSERKDLTNSKLDRQNILNNEMAINAIRESSKINGIFFEDKIYFTKNMLSVFYDVGIRTIERYVANNIEELEKNGYEVLKGKRLKEFLDIIASIDVPDINVGNISNRTPQLAIFDFKSFLNIGMLLVESENARILRQAMLNIVIDLINKKTGGSTKYINQRDKDFLGAYLQEEDYRREFTDALRDYVDMDQLKYAIFTDMIYQSIFKEKAKEYRAILKLEKKDKTRDTFYSEILDLIASYECGLAEMIKKASEEKGRKISHWETQNLFKEFENLPHWKPLILSARSKMASRDMALREAFHQKLEEYIKPLEKEEYEKFLGTESDTIEKLMEENKDVLIRLKERE